MATPEIRDAYLIALPERDRSAYLHDFFTSLENLMRVIGLTLGPTGYLSFYVHLSDVKMAAKHPGAVRSAPPLVPVEPDPDNIIYLNRGKKFDRDVKTYERALAKRTLFDQLTIFLVSSILLKLPPDDVVCIKALDTSLGKPDVFIRIIYYYLDDKYGALAETAQESLRSVITRPLSFETSLDGNFSSMKSANATLSAKGVGFTENQLLREACIKLSKNPRTKPLVEDYKKRDAYHPTSATFTAFSSWAVTQYDNRSVPDGTGAF